MKIELDGPSLRPVIEQVVAMALEQLQAASAQLPGNRLGYPEGEAAALLGLPQHVLRDCRRRGELQAVKVGKRWIYSRDSLQKFLNRG